METHVPRKSYGFRLSRSGQALPKTLANLDVTGVSNGFTRVYRYELKITKYDVNYSDGNLDFMNNIDIISMTEVIS